jgi:hypothetical protein
MGYWRIILSTYKRSRGITWPNFPDHSNDGTHGKKPVMAVKDVPQYLKLLKMVAGTHPTTRRIMWLMLRCRDHGDSGSVVPSICTLRCPR